MVMRKMENILFSLSVVVICLITFNACNSYPYSVPFNEEETEFQKPITEKISFSEGIELKWIEVNALY
jgi:hypothetical protein